MRVVKKELIFVLEQFLNIFIFFLLIPKVRYFNQKLYNNKSDTDIVTVLCKKNVAAYLTMVSSLRYCSQSNFKFSAINDRSLTWFDKRLLNLFDIQVIEAPGCETWQDMKYLGLKDLFTRVLIYIDPDVIFLKYPKLLLETDAVVFMEYPKSRYSLSIEEVRYIYKRPMIPDINTGIFKIHPRLIKSDYYYNLASILSKVFESRAIDIHHLEQTAYACLFATLAEGKGQTKVMKLPLSYCHYYMLDEDKSKLSPDLICIHFTRAHPLARVSYGFKFLLR